MKLSDFLSPERVFLRVDATSKKRIFETAALSFEKTLGLPRKKVFQALLERERLGSTGVGEGCAVPHCRMDGLKAPACAMVHTANPVAFDSADQRPVHTLFFLLVPANANSMHLQILAMLAEVLSDSEFVSRLHNCPDAAAACKLVAERAVPRESPPPAADAAAAAQQAV